MKALSKHVKSKISAIPSAARPLLRFEESFLPNTLFKMVSNAALASERVRVTMANLAELDGVIGKPR
jgi:hypothetical protein